MPPRRRKLRVVLPALAAGALVAAVIWALVGGDALPPRVIVMATGPEGGSYAAYAARYREVLAREGLEVRLRPTVGDGENLALLHDRRSGVSVAMLQSGMTTPEATPELCSLGAIFVQPLWLFRRGDDDERLFAGFAGKRVSLGPEGSGTRVVATRLLRLAGALLPEASALAPDRAAAELQAGRLDAMALVAGWESPLVRRLLADPAVGLVSVPRAEAFVALEPTLEKRVLPMGVGDLAHNRPPRDVTMLTTKASLVVRCDLNPAVQSLLLETASEIHGGPAIFQRPGQFPAAEGIDLPLGDEARRFYRSGRPFLQRYLPYWVAVLVERLLLVFLPLFAIVLPALRAVPELYRQLVQWRVVMIYGELKLIEAALEDRPPGAEVRDLLERLAALEERAGHLRVPLFFSPLLYTLKQHIRLVRTQISTESARRAAADAVDARAP
jgi:TRAP-type uncharacterized transport system substrate-binding protein